MDVLLGIGALILFLILLLRGSTEHERMGDLEARLADVEKNGIEAWKESVEGD